MNVQLLNLAHQYWSVALDWIKAWQDLGKYIDRHPCVAILTRLPSTIPQETEARDKWIWLNLPEEACGLQRDMRTFVIQNLKIVNPEKAIWHSFPQPEPRCKRIYKNMSIFPSRAAQFLETSLRISNPMRIKQWIKICSSLPSF